jgi:uncharacterized tellurite resistance protein B-like protein
MVALNLNVKKVNMIQRLKRFMAQLGQNSPSTEVDYDMAVAILMMEVMLADHAADEREKQQIMVHLRTTMSQSADVERLYEDIKQQVEHANDVFQFTKVINAIASAEQKATIMICLWRVAYADGTLDPYEEQRIRRISELLYVPHSDFIRTKLFVKQAIES